jgi:hypothetical protein
MFPTFNFIVEDAPLPVTPVAFNPSSGYESSSVSANHNLTRTIYKNKIRF